MNQQELTIEQVVEGYTQDIIQLCSHLQYGIKRGVSVDKVAAALDSVRAIQMSAQGFQTSLNNFTAPAPEVTMDDVVEGMQEGFGDMPTEEVPEDEQERDDSDPA